MSKNIVRYEHFAMRLHDENRRVEQPKSWALRAQHGALYSFVVGAVDNPAPAPKVQTESIPGASGALDMTEAAGRVFFENKTVTITLSGEAGFNALDEIERLFAPWQGRKIDFTFDDVLDVKWYMVGRMTAACDRTNNRVILTIDTEPYRRSTTYEVVDLGSGSHQDLNGNGWSERWASDDDASIIYIEKVANSICYGADFPGAQMYIYRAANRSERYTFGIRSIVGGSVEFLNYDEDGNEYFSNVIGVPNSDGELVMRVTVDGSYYEWQVDINDGVKKYMPVVRCHYVLSTLPVTVVNGEAKINDNVLSVNLANIIMRARLNSLTRHATLIVDGVAVDVYPKYNYADRFVDGIIIPGNRAETNGISAKSVMVLTIPDESEDVGIPHGYLSYNPVEVW